MTFLRYSKLSASSPVPTPPFDSVGLLRLAVGVARGEEEDERSGEVGRPEVEALLLLKEEK